MFRLQTPLITLLLLLGWSLDCDRIASAQVTEPQSAQPQARQNLPLSLDEAVKAAEENNKDLKIAELQVVQAEEGLKAARANRTPTLAASGRLFRTDNSTFAANPGNVRQTAEQGRISQQTALNAQIQRQQARTEFQEQLQRLQVQLQRDTDLSQQDNVNQQLTELERRSNAAAALPNSTSENPLPPFSGFTPSTSVAINSGIQNTVEGTLTLSYNILTGGSRPALIRVAKKQLESAQLDVQRLKRQLRLNVANDYYDLQEVRALMRVALSAVANAEQTLNNTILTEAAGLSTKFEILQADVQLANATQNLNLAQGLQLTAQRQLAETLNLEGNLNLVPTDDVDLIGDWTTQLADSIVVAQNNRLELQQILLNRDIQKEQRTIAKSAKRPNLSSFAQLNASASDVELENAPLNANNFRGDVGYSVGLQVNLNAFDGGEIKAQVKEINENIKILETQYDNQKNEIRLEVEQSFYALEQNRENIQTSRGALDLARESLELARLRLKAGIGTQLDVIQAETDLTQAEGNVISAVLDYNRAIASIARATAFQLVVGNYSGSSFAPQSGGEILLDDAPAGE